MSGRGKTNIIDKGKLLNDNHEVSIFSTNAVLKFFFKGFYKYVISPSEGTSGNMGKTRYDPKHEAQIPARKKIGKLK